MSLLHPSLLWPTHVAVLALLVAGCGGSASPVVEPGARSVPAQAASASFSTADSPRPEGNLSAMELEAAERLARLTTPQASPLDQLRPGQPAAWDDYASGKVAAKSTAVRIPAFRFFNGSTGAHFFTTNTVERDNVIAAFSAVFGYEGPAFSVASAFSSGLSPVYRFYNTQTGVHFYTISESERAQVAANLPQFRYEGVAYHASQITGAGLTPLYRFYVPSRGFHFYTASLSERDYIIANLSATYSYEGVGYHVLSTEWQAQPGQFTLPHTGVTTEQCYQAGSDTLVACASAGATALNPRQDGHRTNINPLSYSPVSSFPLTSCVRDNVTGLVWEGKEPDGLRAGSNTYTNLGNSAASDASGYVNYVNSIALCGHTDWRLPTVSELASLWNAQEFSGLDPNHFPNSPTILWSSQEFRLPVDDVPPSAWRVSFGPLPGSSAWPIESTYGVQLVRGALFSGTRFTVTTVPYGSDSPNNVVIDQKTGLQWRRCAEGRTWNGSQCVGIASEFDHQNALQYASARPGWRLPNIKEIASIMDHERSIRPALDEAAFPNMDSMGLWTSTPNVQYGGSLVGKASTHNGSWDVSSYRDFTDGILLLRN